MATISEALAIAIHHHQAGRLKDAEQIYRRILAVEPKQVDALHLLGVIAFQMGKHEVAIQYIQRAIGLNGTAAYFHSSLAGAHCALGRFPEAIASYRRAVELKPDFADAHYSLGNVLKDQGKLDEAIACYRRVLELKPDFAEAHNNLGNVLKAQRELDEAIACYRRVLELKPDFAEVYNNLGNALKNQGKLGEAVACYRRSQELKPGFAEAKNNLGNALKDQGRLDEAVECYRRVRELKPDFAEAHNNLGSALKGQGKLDEAVTCYRRAIELKPDLAEVHSNLGNTLKDQGKLDEAVACYRRALELKPDLAEAHSNLGNVLRDQGKLEEAVACCRRALELKPDFAEAHSNHSVLSLLTGDLEHGWAEYEWRWKAKTCNHRDFVVPLWDGQPLKDRTILLHAEQGLGDTIQFVRYAPLVKKQGGTVIVECQRPILSLLSSCAGIDRLVGQGEDLPAFDLQTPLLSLPGIFHTTLRDLPATAPYLFADPNLVEGWQRELGGITGFKIGVAWQGNPRNPNDRVRSIPLGSFEPLARCCGVQLLSLQKGPGVEQLQRAAQRFPIMELGSRLRDFMDTAAVIMNLDLVITCDTAVAHLAGALGVPVWVAIPFVPDWRWLLDRDDSPWYPTMRLFRQESRGDWQGVFRRIAAALDEHLASHATRPGLER